MIEIAVVASDIAKRPCDLLVLKHADGFHGVDAMVAQRLGFASGVPEGEPVFLSGKNLKARKVLFIGVGPLVDFRYQQIRSFARRALALAASGTGRTKIVCSPLHGPGYGLDERESFLSLVGGFLDGLKQGNYPQDLERIEIVDISARKAARLKTILQTLTEELRGSISAEGSLNFNRNLVGDLSGFGKESELKTKLFVAMPFAAEHSDIWEIAVQEACQAAGVLCERIDQQSYVGDIVTQIKDRVSKGNGVLAVLDDANPNVFLEIGFAWGTGKPTVLMARKGSVLPFDVRGQKCLMYASIADLRSSLAAELKALKRQGVFGPR